MQMSDKDKLEYVSGRLYGLCGTVRYDIPEKLRLELKELAAMITDQTCNPQPR